MRIGEFFDQLFIAIIDAWLDWHKARDRAPDPGPGFCHRQSAVVVGPTVSIPITASVSTRVSESALVIGPSDVVRVEPPRRPAWDERGWRRRVLNGATAYEGEYRVRRPDGSQLSFPGQIQMSGRVPATYIADPPPELRRHRHGPCFQLAKAPWFRVHWHRAPRNVDDALLYVERVLDEAVR